MKITDFIDLVDHTLQEAIKYGGEVDGSSTSNTEDLAASIEDLLKVLGISDYCFVSSAGTPGDVTIDYTKKYLEHIQVELPYVLKPKQPKEDL